MANRTNRMLGMFGGLIVAGGVAVAAVVVTVVVRAVTLQ